MDADTLDLAVWIECRYMIAKMIRKSTQKLWQRRRFRSNTRLSNLA